MRVRSLEQLLQVRALLEKRQQRELADVIAGQQRLEQEACREQRLALLSRGEVLRDLQEKSAEAWWSLGIVDAEILEKSSENTRRRAELEMLRVAAGREEMLERRRDRLQVETLVEAARRAEKQERERREQQRLDDWFQGRREPIDAGEEE